MRQQTAVRKHSRGLHDPLKLRGYLEWQLRDATTGEVVGRGKKENTVTAWGRGFALAKACSASGTQIMSAIAIGSSSTAPTSNDSQLGGYATIRAFGTQGLTSATNTACTFYGAVSFASNETWTNSSQIGEFAIYCSGATAGGAVMFNRLNTATYINFATSNTLAISISITN